MNARTAIAGHIPTWATPAADAGAVANTAPQLLTFDIARSPEVQAAFDQMLVDQQNPSSPRYHQWLTPQQVGEQFGPTQHDLDALTAWLTTQGFTVTSIAPSRVFVQATAPASVVSNALQTSLHNFTVNGARQQAPLTEPKFPSALAPVVKFVAGLATVQYHAFSHTMPALPLSALGINPAGASTPAIHPDYTLGSGTVHYLAPADFNLIYDVTPTLTAGTTGTGQRVAIIGGSRLLASDVTSWESISALAAYQPNYIVPAGLTDPGTTSDGNQGEATLDFERVYGTAPGSQVDLVISKNALSTDTDTLQLYAINTLNDPVMTMSYGACETGYAAYAQHENSLFSQAIIQGISVFASSGDAGIAGCEQQGVAPPATQYASVEVPCDSAYLTCVGGTQFSDTANPNAYWSATNGTGKLSALSYIPEGAWNEPSYTTSTGATAIQVASSTGGPSVAITKPSWQTGSTIPADGARDVPDVSFSASGHNAYFSCLAYAGADCTTYVTGFGGTSAAAPSMAGLAALIDQKMGKRQGLLNPLLYATATSTPAAFHDATPATSGVSSCTTSTPSTCNNSDPSPSSYTSAGIVGYPLLTGYDFPTGLGSLDFGRFLAAISLPTPTIALTAAPTTITISQTVQFTVKLTGTTATPTGTVQLSSNGNALGGPLALVNGSVTSASLSFTPAGTYSITATYSGDTNYSPVTSTAFSLVVTNPAAIASSSVLSVTPNPATTAQSTTLVATVKAAGTSSVVPTGTVQFYDGGVAKGLPVTLTNTGIAALTVGNVSAGTHVFTCIYAGDNTYSSSSCAAVSDAVTALPSTTVQTASTTVLPASGTLTLSYTVSSTSGGTPTGTITVYAAETSPTVIPAAPIGSVSLASGTVTTPSISGLTPGVYTFYGAYSGDAIYAASNSTPPVTITVTGFGMTATPSLSFSAGATSGNAATITYSSINGFTGTITQTCSLAPSGVAAVPVPPPAPSCAASVALSGTSATSVVTIGSSASAVSTSPISVGFLRTGALGGVSLAGLFLLLIPARRRRVLGSWRALSLLFFLSLGLFAVSGCGSGGSSAGGGNGGTTRGAYVLTVTATSSGQVSTTTTNVSIN
jgi:hypothetical protein